MQLAIANHRPETVLKGTQVLVTSNAEACAKRFERKRSGGGIQRIDDRAAFRNLMFVFLQ